VSTPAITVGACFGDALMAAQAVKYPGFESYDALTNYIQEGVIYQPDPEKHQAYLKYRKIYDALYPLTADLVHDLSK
jgi:xylulokinase